MDGKVLKGYTSSGSWGLPRSIARGGTEDPVEAENEYICVIILELAYPCLGESKLANCEAFAKRTYLIVGNNWTTHARDL